MTYQFENGWTVLESFRSGVPVQACSPEDLLV
jgi:hypothetical protein